MHLETSLAIHTYTAHLYLFYRAGFADKANQDVASTFVTEVKTHLPDIPSVTIKGKSPFRNGVIIPIL